MARGIRGPSSKHLLRLAPVSTIVLVTIFAVSCDRQRIQVSPQSDPESVVAFRAAIASAKGRSSYHISANVTVASEDRDLTSALGGNYEVDFEKPEKFRTIWSQDSIEKTRTISIGEAVFSSEDRGETWDESTLDERQPPVPDFLKLLDDFCSVSGTPNNLNVEIKQAARGCESPLNVQVQLADSELESVTASLPVREGKVHVTARYDFDAVVPSIVAPVASGADQYRAV